MSPNVIRAIAIIGSSILATSIVSVIFRIAAIEDEALKVTFIALLASGFSLEIFLRLSKDLTKPKVDD